MIALLSPRVWLALVLAAVLSFTHFFAYRAGKQEVRVQWDADKAEAVAAAAAQAARNRDLQRAAEIKYTVAAESRDRFIVTTVKEIRNATDNLAACRVAPDAVRLFNDAAKCARQDRPASCGAGQPVPIPG